MDEDDYAAVLDGSATRDQALRVALVLSAALEETHAKAERGRKVTPYYDDGTVTIYHGDARNLLPELGHFDLCLTDPPYGIGYTGWGGAAQGPRKEMDGDAIRALALYRDVIRQLDVDHVLWFTRWDVWPDVWQILGAVKKMRGLLVWDKGHPGMGDLSHWGPSYELIASAGVGSCVGSRDGSTLRFNAPAPTGRVHPTQKPVDLLAHLIAKLAATSVVDPFMGSGSTLLAARQLGTRAVGVEIDERYCEVAARRFDQMEMAA